MQRLLEVKLDWEPDSPQEVWRYQALNGIYNIGAIIGALGCSRILPYGRRYTLLVTSGIYLAAASIT